jgi:cytochrome d ubiquinol oxidase subunit II
VLALVFLIWIQADKGDSGSLVALIVAALALVGAIGAIKRGREGWSFALSGITIAATFAMLFLTMFPNVMPSSLDPDWSLTVSNASSSPYTLKIMTWLAAIATPLVLLYQSWTYWVFRKRIGTKHIADAAH